MSSTNGFSGSLSMTPDRYSYLEDSGVFLQRKRDSASSASTSSSMMKPPKVKPKRIMSSNRGMPRKPFTLLGPRALPFPSQYYDPHSDAPYMYQCFDVLDKIGEGCFGTVYKVRSKDDDKLYAIKKSSEEISFNSFHHKQARNEGRFQFQLSDHPNIVTVYQAWEEKGCVYVQLELCQQSLEDFSRRTHDIDERIIIKILFEMCSALKYVHANGFIHLDVKPANIMISEDRSACKLGDFGLITNVRDGSFKDIDEGDSKYLAPEVLSHCYTPAADIFSLGITILELACDLVLPGNGESWQQLRQTKIPQNLTTKVSDQVVQIIVSMMTRDWRARPSAQQVIDALMTSMRDEQEETDDDLAGLLEPTNSTVSSLYTSLENLITSAYYAVKGKLAGIWDVLCNLIGLKEYDIPEIQANAAMTSTPLGNGGSRPPLAHRRLAFALSDDDSD